MFVDRLDSALNEKKVTQKELAEFLGIRRPTISEWKKRGTIPSGDICLKIANYLDVSIEWLISGNTQSALSCEHRTILKMYDFLDTIEKKIIYSNLETLYKVAKERKLSCC